MLVALFLPTVETIETVDIPLNYRLTLGENGANFIIHRVSTHNPQHDNRFEGYIVLGDPQLIVQLLNCSVVATDGTFAIAPPPFLQLTSFVFFFTNVHNLTCITYTFVLFSCRSGHSTLDNRKWIASVLQ